MGTELDVGGLKGWIEELSARNKSLEKENESLKNKNLMDEENKKLRQENESLKQEIKRLKLMVTRMAQQLGIIIPRYNPTGQIVTPSPQSSPRTNPFLIQEIVRIMMDYVDGAHDLKSCRRVCKIWNDAAKKGIQEKLTFRLIFNPYMRQKVSEFLAHVVKSFPSFRHLSVDLTAARGDVLPSTFNTLFLEHGRHLHSVVLTLGHYEMSMVNFRDLFLASLNEIRELEINGLGCRLIHEPVIFTPNHSIKILPHLKSLHIEMDEPNCTQTQYHGNSAFWSHLFQIAPNLTTLHWRCTSHVRPGLSNESRKMIESLIGLDPTKFENLFINCPIPTTLVEILAICDLRLHQLYLTEVEGFEVHLVRLTSISGKKSNLTPKRVCYSGIPGTELKQYLENKLNECGEAYCTTLLKTLSSALAAKLSVV